LRKNSQNKPAVLIRIPLPQGAGGVSCGAAPIAVSLNAARQRQRL
jgi:hypothetical protein